jgi:hypothetical protein
VTGTDPRVYRAFLAALSDTIKAPSAERMLRAADMFSTTSKAEFFARLGRFDEAMALLEEDFAARNPRLPWVNVHPWFEGLRSNPRFQALLRRMNL